jgi:hypothetical protein
MTGPHECERWPKCDHSCPREGEVLALEQDALDGRALRLLAETGAVEVGVLLTGGAMTNVTARMADGRVVLRQRATIAEAADAVRSVVLDPRYQLLR